MGDYTLVRGLTVLAVRNTYIIYCVHARTTEARDIILCKENGGQNELRQLQLQHIRYYDHGCMHAILAS